MIPAIGIMIGAYIFTKMIEILFRTDKVIVLKCFAVITMFITVIAVLDLIVGGIRGLPAGLR